VTRLEALGFNVDIKKVGPGTRVAAQNPTGGQFKKGSTVTVFVNQ